MGLDVKCPLNAPVSLLWIVLTVRNRLTESGIGLLSRRHHAGSDPSAPHGTRGSGYELVADTTSTVSEPVEIRLDPAVMLSKSRRGPTPDDAPSETRGKRRLSSHCHHDLAAPCPAALNTARARFTVLVMTERRWWVDTARS